MHLHYLHPLACFWLPHILERTVLTVYPDVGIRGHGIRFRDGRPPGRGRPVRARTSAPPRARRGNWNAVRRLAHIPERWASAARCGPAPVPVRPPAFGRRVHDVLPRRQTVAGVCCERSRGVTELWQAGSGRTDGDFCESGRSPSARHARQAGYGCAVGWKTGPRQKQCKISS